jgi:preprotein translocase subunit SecA
VSSASLRPGIALGAYPERDAPREAWLERTTRAAIAPLARRRRAGPANLKQFLARVHERAPALEGMSSAALDAETAELRLRLRASAFDDDLVARAFALVRETAGRRLGMRHFDSQLVGGFVMMRGFLAEMETGEGKTLTATLPACTAALAGVPVHIITVNDYLVGRDAEQMEPVYAALGIRVGAVSEQMPDPASRRAAYACDVTYCTNKQLAFDYLRDRLVMRDRRGRLALQLERLRDREPRAEKLLLRGLCFAIVDEADSVLVDEARTPLLISRDADAAEEQRLYERSLELARQLTADVDFRLHPRKGEVELTPGGCERLTDLGASEAGTLRGARRREELVRQALVALHLFERDVDYLVRDAKVQIIDPHTGRLMPDRSWERGLHQLIELKEGCPITCRKETLARITYQRFFRRYLHLSGMTGTAREVAGELRAVYALDVVRVPTHRPVRRRDLGQRFFETALERSQAVVRRIGELHRQGRPVLVGTRSVAASEELSRLLGAAGLPHQVLNARQDAYEARIVAGAGEPGCITVATNMAGRGTDIRLGRGVAKRGGLHLLQVERNESRRVDRQLVGRCGRQGDPGSFEAWLSLEDELVINRFPSGVPDWLRILRRLGPTVRCGCDQALMWTLQRAVERRHRSLRWNLLRQDERLSEVLAFTGPLE